MKLVVGLGNPGDKYVKSRHNCGYILLDHYAQENNLVWSISSKLKANITKISSVTDKEEVLLAKPTTFMNLSGDSVMLIYEYYNFKPEDLLVIHDDVDLPNGKFKHQFSGGSAGHHGIEDIISKIKTKDFWRLRVGVGRPEDYRFNIEDYVLQNLSTEQINVVKSINLDSIIKNSVKV